MPQLPQNYCTLNVKPRAHCKAHERVLAKLFDPNYYALGRLWACRTWHRLSARCYVQSKSRTFVSSVLSGRILRMSAFLLAELLLLQLDGAAGRSPSTPLLQCCCYGANQRARDHVHVPEYGIVLCHEYMESLCSPSASPTNV